MAGRKLAASGEHPAWQVQTVSVPGPDTDLALFVAFGNAKLLFGAAEGTQRAFAQKKRALRGLQGIFLPGGSRGRSGLPGILMTIADAGIKHVAVAGDPALVQYLATLRSSVVRDQISIETSPFTSNHSEPDQLVFSSPRVSVYGVALRSPAPIHEGSANPSRPSQLSAAEREEWTNQVVQDMFRGPGAQQTKRAASRWPNMSRPSYPDDRYPLPLVENDVATDMVFICRTPDVRGKFDAAKAEQLKVFRADRGKLAKGQSVEVNDPSAPNGKRVVNPEDVISGGTPGSILIVINCKTHNLANLLSSTAFSSHQSDLGPPEMPVHCIVHRVSREVWHNPTYQAWVKTFGPQAQNLYADDQGTGEMFFNSAAWNALKLNMLNADIFPVPNQSNANYSAPTLPENTFLLVPNTVISMYPRKAAEVQPRHEKDQQFPTDPMALDATRQQLREESPEYAAAVDEARASVALEESKRGTVADLPGDNIVVTTLGTGSAVPSKYRNVSATHLDIPDVGGILLDCGEGTLGQMRRRWGPDIGRIYSDLRMIFISHMHADHHLGLATVLEDRFRNGIQTPLYLVAPHPIALQLQETASWQAGVPRAALENVRFVSTNRLKRGYRPRRRSQSRSLPRESMDVDGVSDRPAISRESPSRDDGSIDYNLVVEQIAGEDVAAGTRRWPFENVSRFHPDCNARMEDTIFSLLEDLGLYEIIAPQVAHRGAAWGLVLSHKSGWKIAYSGDTKPCDVFVDAAQGATVMIHEATLEDDKTEHAVLKGHSTFGQAIDVGSAAGARYVILNHFSQRYPKIPKLPVASQTGEGPTVAISFDFMSLRVKDTWKIAHYMKALEILYAEEEDDVDDIREEGVDEKEEAQANVQAAGKKQPESNGTGAEAERSGEANPRAAKRSSTASPGAQDSKKAREK